MNYRLVGPISTDSSQSLVIAVPFPDDAFNAFPLVGWATYIVDENVGRPYTHIDPVIIDSSDTVSLIDVYPEFLPHKFLVLNVGHTGWHMAMNDDQHLDSYAREIGVWDYSQTLEAACKRYPRDVRESYERDRSRIS